MKVSVLKILMIALVFSVVACSGNGAAAESETTDTTEQEGKEYTSKYICPMHCEGSGSEEPGKCPVCGMDYVLNEDN